VMLRLDQTGGNLQYGPENGDIREPYTVQSGTLFDGDTELLNWPDGHRRDALIALQQSSPLPCMIVGIFPTMDAKG